jgi:cholesterol transport system auxiliary component
MGNRQLRHCGPKLGKLLRAACFAGAAVILPGCASLLVGSPPPLDTFSLTAPEVSAKPRASRAQLLITEPTALKDLDSQNIVIRTAPAEVQYLSGAQWSDRLPALVQARLIQAFEGTRRFGGVGRPGQGLAIDYQILIDIRDLSVSDTSGGRSARAEITAKILNDRNGSLRGTRTFDAAVAVGGSENSDYVRALDTAFGSVASDIVSWVASTI